MKLSYVKAKDSGGDTIPGYLPQAWHKPRGVPIPDTQVSFVDEEGGGCDEVVAVLSSGFHGRGSPSLEEE